MLRDSDPLHGTMKDVVASYRRAAALIVGVRSNRAKAGCFHRLRRRRQECSVSERS